MVPPPSPERSPQSGAVSPKTPRAGGSPKASLSPSRSASPSRSRRGNPQLLGIELLNHGLLQLGEIIGNGKFKTVRRAKYKRREVVVLKYCKKEVEGNEVKILAQLAFVCLTDAKKAALLPPVVENAKFKVGMTCDVAVNSIVMKKTEGFDSDEVKKLVPGNLLEVLQIGTGPTGKRVLVREKEEGLQGWVSVAAKDNTPLLKEFQVPEKRKSTRPDLRSEKSRESLSRSRASTDASSSAVLGPRLEDITFEPLRHVPEIFGMMQERDAILMLQEIAVFGSLETMLKHEKTAERVTPQHRLEISKQLSRGMAFMQSQRVVHADLACRNVLVYQFEDENPAGVVVKLSDFGLSVVLDEGVDHVVVKQPRAIRWCSPENNAENKLSFRSDCWALGCVIWEIFANGALPWCKITVRSEVQDKIMGITEAFSANNAAAASEIEQGDLTSHYFLLPPKEIMEQQGTYAPWPNAAAKLANVRSDDMGPWPSILVDFPCSPGCPIDAYCAILSCLKMDEYRRPTFLALEETFGRASLDDPSQEKMEELINARKPGPPAIVIPEVVESVVRKKGKKGRSRRKGLDGEDLDSEFGSLFDEDESLVPRCAHIRPAHYQLKPSEEPEGPPSKFWWPGAAERRCDKKQFVFNAQRRKRSNGRIFNNCDVARNLVRNLSDDQGVPRTPRPRKADSTHLVSANVARDHSLSRFDSPPKPFPESAARGGWAKLTETEAGRTPLWMDRSDGGNLADKVTGGERHVPTTAEKEEHPCCKVTDCIRAKTNGWLNREPVHVDATPKIGQHDFAKSFSCPALVAGPAGVLSVSCVGNTAKDAACSAILKSSPE